jgi:predicted amidohydrolase
MSDCMRVAAIQMSSGPERQDNLLHAERSIAEAAAAGARLVVLPENFALFGVPDAERLAAAEVPGRGPIQDFLAAQAAQHRVWLVGGTLPIRADARRASAAALLYDPLGRCAGRYDKIHLFDVDLPGPVAERYRESDATAAGTEPGCFDTELGGLGLAVCYDLRFPALFHRLGELGAAILAIPAAFTAVTGAAHWDVLLRARAIESLSYVVAAAQWGCHPNGRETYGHSMILGPWGEVLATKAVGLGPLVADLDLAHLRTLRARFPALAHRREL